MSCHIDGSRNSCALHGALQLIEAIEGVVPVVHSNAGCGLHYHLGVSRAGASGSPFGAPPVSSSNVSEKHVVFGGSSRLREQLKNTVKIVDGELYFIVSGCSTEMVGDDIPAMAREGRDQNFPVVYANTPGFRGDVHHGYQLAARALIEQLPALNHPDPEVSSGKVVNLLGVIPHQDPFWQGNLEEIGRLLRGIGLEPNLLVGPGQDIASWRRAPHAVLNLVLSFWGEAPASLLGERYGIPSLVFGGIPVGFAASDLLRLVSDQLNLEGEAVERFIHAEEQRLLRHLSALADTYFRAGFQRDFILVGESSLVAGIGSFLTDTLGLVPRAFIVTDELPEPDRVHRLEGLGQLAGRYGAELVFSGDLAEIADFIRAARPGLLLGSALEGPVASELAIPLLQVSFPAGDRVIFERASAGYRGAAALVEDLGSELLQSLRHGAEVYSSIQQSVYHE